MTAITRATSRLALCLALIGALMLPAAAGAELAEVSTDAAAIVFQPNAAYDGMVLTVSGPAGDFRSEFDGAAMPYFEIFDAAGQTLADGTYSWELKATPKLGPQLRAELAAARADGDRARIDALPPAGSLVQSGYFTVAGGSIVDERAGEPASLSGASTAAASTYGSELQSTSAAAQVYTTDLVVQGSECVGVDCNTNENYGSDTIRMKENNLRIHFNDTSSSGSFPKNDWRIIANDTNNGGASYLAIEDSTAGKTPFKVVAGARNNALYVDADGDVGIGTPNPIMELHAVTGDTPTLRLEQDGSSGFTAQTWDVAGNETNFFVRDVNHSSHLPFRIRANAPDNAMYIAANGNLHLGGENPQNRIHISDDSAEPFGFSLADGSTGGYGKTWQFLNNPTNGAFTATADADGGNAPFKVFPGATTSALVLGSAGGAAQVSMGTATDNVDVKVYGSISVDGTVVHADYVFEPDYPLLPIAEQGAFMMANKHLPAVGKGEGPVEIVSHQMGVLEELEKAHLYIQQLHGEIEALEVRAAERETAKEAAIAGLTSRLEALEAALH